MLDQQNSSAIYNLTKLLSLVLVLGLLIGHGTKLPEKSTLRNVSPCVGLESDPDRPNPLPYCIDYENTSEDIAALQGLTVLDRGLYILTTDLENLDFLSNIVEIQGEFRLLGNDLLTNIATGSVSFVLTQIQSLYIAGNDVLPNLQGLNGVTAIPGDITIAMNNQLSTLGDIRFGTTLGNVEILRNDQLADIAALQDTTSVSQLYLEGNGLLNVNDLNNLTTTSTLYLSEDNIVSLSGLDNLQTAGDLTIIAAQIPDFSGLNSLVTFFSLSLSCDLIASLNGLSNGQTTLSRLAIGGNASLTDISALSNVDTVTGDVVLSWNSVLPNLQGLEQIVSIGGELTIQGNTDLTTTASLGNLISANSLTIDRNALLTDLSLTSLNRLEESFTITNNNVLCERGTNSANSLLQQILAGGGIGAVGNTTEGITISGNLACP